MPSIKDFENKAKQNKSAESAKQETDDQVAASDESLDLEVRPKKARSSRRRPGRDQESAQVLPEEQIETNNENEHKAEETSRAHETSDESGATFDDPADAENEKIQLHFNGSDILRAQAPKVMEVADSIVNDWVKDGDFSQIEVGHPAAEKAVVKVLQKAKQIEKKLEEKGVFLVAQMGLDYLKSKLKK